MAVPLHPQAGAAGIHNIPSPGENARTAALQEAEKSFHALVPEARAFRSACVAAGSSAKELGEAVLGARQGGDEEARLNPPLSRLPLPAISMP